MLKVSITRKLMILFFAVGLCALTVVGAYSYLNAKKAILKRTLEQLTSIRVIKKEQIEFFFNERFKNLFFLSNNDYVRNLVFSLNRKPVTPENFNKEAQEAYSKAKEKINFPLYGFSYMYILYSDAEQKLNISKISEGEMCTSENDLNLINTLSNFWKNESKSDTTFILDFVKNSNTNQEPIFFIGRRINDINGNRCGVLALQIPISAINEIMLEKNPENGLGNSGEIYLVGQDYLMRSQSRFIKNSVMQTLVNTVSVNNAFKNQIGSTLIDDYRTIAVLSSYDRVNIPGLSWAIIAEIDYAEAMIPIVSLRNDILFLSALICVFLFSVAHIISRSITQPIIRLKNAAVKIGEGDFNVNLKPSANDEIGLLTESFNTMSVQLNEERLKRMSALYDGQELERQRISRELHDSLGQKLIAIKFHLESTSRQCNESAKQNMEEVNSEFLKVIEELREISNNLAPNILKESGIDVALKNLCTSIQHSTNTEVDFSAYGDYITQDEKLKTYLYRIVQESLNNAIKHSGADKIHVQLMGNKDHIILVLEDNGKGFSLDKISSGNGIFNMKERAHVLNASFDIESEPGVGTTVRLKIPKNLLKNNEDV